MPATNADWVLAVDVRDGGRRTAVAGPSGVRAGDGEHADRPPLAVVVVHPGGWPAERVDAALADVAGTAPGPEWPAPVPLAAAEAAAWRALEFGLLPGRARVVVLDPVAGEATVLDRDGDSLQPVGAVLTLEDAAAAGAAGGVDLARRALEAAPPGPPFTGVLLAGVQPGASDDAELPGLLARVTGRAPLVPGDAAQVAVLGAAALGWAAATAGEELPAPGPPAAGPRVLRRPAGELPGPVPPRRRRLRIGPRMWTAAALAALVVVAIVAGLGWHRARTTPSPYTVTCPDGQVVAYSFECPTLAPSSSP